MKGIRFYLEYPNAAEKRKATRDQLGNHSGLVIAAFEGTEMIGRSGPQIDALSGLSDRPNAPAASGAVSLDYLRERTKRISEAQARKIHPELFRRLDQDTPGKPTGD
jgi:hypothetical protein